MTTTPCPWCRVAVGQKHVGSCLLAACVQSGRTPSERVRLADCSRIHGPALHSAKEGESVAFRLVGCEVSVWTGQTADEPGA